LICLEASLKPGLTLGVAVISDICRDYGIAPGQLDRAYWQEPQPCHHHLWRQSRHRAPAAVRPQPRRPGGARVVSGTVAIAGARHPARPDEPSIFSADAWSRRGSATARGSPY